MITIEDVNRFLDEFKVKAKVFGIIYRDDRKKNYLPLFVAEYRKRGLSSPWRAKTTHKVQSWRR